MQNSNKRPSKYHPFGTDGNLPPLDISKYINSGEKTLPDIPWPFYHQKKNENDADEYCSPLLPFSEKYSKNNIPAFIKEAFNEKMDLVDEYLNAELAKKNFQVISNQLPSDFNGDIRVNCMICYKIIHNEELKSQNSTIITLKSNGSGNIFFFHSKCLQNNHSHISESSMFAIDELKTIRHFHYFSKTELQIPSLTDQNFVNDEQIYSLKMKFYNVINHKTPFLKLERDLKQITKMSWEEDFSVKKNLQTNFLNFILDEKEEKKFNPFYNFYNPMQYLIPLSEFRVTLSLYRFENGEKYDLETIIQLPLDQPDESDFLFESIKQNQLLKLSFVFNLIPLDKFSSLSNFPTFLSNSNYAESLKKIYSLQNISLFLKSPPGYSNLEDTPTRPKSSSLRSPIKSNTQTVLPNSELNKFKKGTLNPAALNFPVPNFLSPMKNQNSPSPQSYGSIASPKVSYEDPAHNAFNEESPKSPGYIGELPSFEEMKGNILGVAKSQNGSRILQKFFVKCTQGELESILLEIRTHISNLMLDTYANYMFQTLIQRCTPQQRLFILNEIASSLVLLACDKKGTHSIQALVSLINCEEEEILVIDTIKNDIFSLIMDSQGTHFIQKIVLRFKDDRLKVIFECILNHFIEISNNSGGVCVLKGIMTKFKEMKQERKAIINLLIKNLDMIIQNPYGNYALQHAIDEGDIDEILDKILPKVLQLSNHKFSSNVIEKCILTTNLEYKRKFIKEISQDSIILELMKNKYGNFVLKKCCMVADAVEFDLLFLGISKNFPFLQNSQYKTVWKEFITNSMTFNNQNMIKF